MSGSHRAPMRTYPTLVERISAGQTDPKSQTRCRPLGVLLSRQLGPCRRRSDPQAQENPVEDLASKAPGARVQAGQGPVGDPGLKGANHPRLSGKPESIAVVRSFL